MPLPIGSAALNSATKYPSIPTYHRLDPESKGRLTEEPTGFTDRVILTEKVDGTNARIVIGRGGDWVIGEREEFLTARGDRIANPAQQIVSSLSSLDKDGLSPLGDITVYYLEAYGGSIGRSAKQYTSTRALGYRLFDVAVISREILDWPVERVSSWRKRGGQTFLPESELQSVAYQCQIPLTPRLGTVDARALPATLTGMSKWLIEALPSTHVGLDGGGKGQAEGLVLRSPDRSVIAKARIADYRRTLESQ